MHHLNDSASPGFDSRPMHQDVNDLLFCAFLSTTTLFADLLVLSVCLDHFQGNIVLVLVKLELEGKRTINQDQIGRMADTVEKTVKPLRRNESAGYQL